ncbi:hypothetical protein ACYZTM_27840 [Pseudomonas sp. MDT2-39-1]
MFDTGVVAVFTALPALLSSETQGLQRTGVKAAHETIQAALPEHRFVFRTDVKSYYASMSHQRLMADLAEPVRDPHLLH